ncbi:MAG: biopolymer transporter ExbD [Candidatus Ancaeobacter aquaticus]|nr:biopolymer transporter ExbD [Candidatus Ancaeobacter aquaticus]
MRRTQWSRTPSALRSEINVTSLVDVTLVLLIIFLIVAPIIQQGIKVRLPKATTKKLASPDNLTISIAEDNKIYFGETRLTLEDLKKRLDYLAKTKPESFIVIRADKDLRFKTVVTVLDMLRNAGLHNTGIATEKRKIRK